MSSLHRWREDVVTSTMDVSDHEKGTASAKPRLPPLCVSDPNVSLPVPVLVKSDRPARFRGRIIVPRPITNGWSALQAHVKEKLSTPASEMPPLGAQAYKSQDNPSILELSTPKFLVHESTRQVDDVVVDRSSWSDDDSSIKSDVLSCLQLSSNVAKNKNGVPEARHFPDEHTPSFWSSCKPLRFLRWHFAPVMRDFFYSKFDDEDPEIEERYQKEMWAQSKRPSLWASVFFIMNWVLSMAFIPRPIVIPDQIFYYGAAGILTVPLLLMNLYDTPRNHSISYQTFLSVSTWSWSLYQVFFIYLCNGYDYNNDDAFSCAKDDFLPTFYYTSALLAVALFGLHLKRLAAALAGVIFLILSTVLVTPHQPSWTRNIVNTIVYDAVLLYMHYQRELSQRRVFVLRLELNRQCDHTQDAMGRAQKEADSKRRLTSYVFHEVRVPLNTALLAVQNMEATGAASQKHDIEFNALRGSLTMMSKVLNDVLDFNRMDSGRFESVSKPYAFHSVINSLLLPMRMATDARQLKLETDLDPEIDNIARRAELEAQGEPSQSIQQHLLQHPSGPGERGVVVGDETRLRQIVTNLASNAIKFTAKGGKLRISTKLIYPSWGALKGTSAPTAKSGDSPTTSNNVSLSEELLTRHELNVTSASIDKIVVRIEVSDTGSGIKPSDLTDGKLFSAFNQTEQGRMQGGKGTGLGLALVRQIVRLSHGRLGVRSVIGEGSGSTFWFELPLGIGKKALEYNGPPVPGTAGPLSPNMNAGEFFQDAAEAAKVAAPDKGFGNSSPSPRSSIAVERSMVKPPTHRVGSSTISSSALHGLMDQGGRFELTLSGYEGHSSVPTRTIGDSSTGTEFTIAPPTPTTIFHDISSLQHSPVPSDVLKSNLLPSAPGSARTSPEVEMKYGFFEHFHPSSLADGSHPATPVTELTPCMRRSSGMSGSSMQGSSQHSAHETCPAISLNTLVVDDDKLTRTLMKRMLTRLGHTVSTAENGATALAMILGVSEAAVAALTESEPKAAVYSTSPFHIVFLDNQMPVCSGLQATRTLRALGREDFVVGVTGNALLADQQEYLDAGANHVLIKPVLEKSLRAMLQVAIQKQQKTQ